MTEEEVAEYRKTEKEISIIMQKNLKLKSMKKPEEPVQILDPIEQDPSTGRNQAFFGFGKVYWNEFGRFPLYLVV